MSKIMEAYAQRRGLNKDALRFTLDGERIPADQTPKVGPEGASIRNVFIVFH